MSLQDSFTLGRCYRERESSNFLAEYQRARIPQTTQEVCTILELTDICKLVEAGRLTAASGDPAQEPRAVHSVKTHSLGAERQSKTTLPFIDSSWQVRRPNVIPYAVSKSIAWFFVGLTSMLGAMLNLKPWKGPTSPLSTVNWAFQHWIGAPTSAANAGGSHIHIPWKDWPFWCIEGLLPHD